MLQKYQISAQLMNSRQFKAMCIILPTLTPFHNTFHKNLWLGSDIFGTIHTFRKYLDFWAISDMITFKTEVLLIWVTRLK